MTSKPPKRRAGRPAGSRNLHPPVVTAATHRCPACGSTDREKYHRTEESPYHGPPRDDGQVTHIIRRWTKCSACGQHRIDRFYENRTAPALPDTVPFRAPADASPPAVEARPAA